VKDPDRLLPLLDGLYSAIAAIPAKPGRVTRRVREDALPADFINRHKTGSLVRYNGLTSTAEMGGKMPPGDVLITITHSSGRIIRDFSQYGTEREILLPPGSVFRVISARRLKSGLRINLEEVTDVPPNSQVYDFSSPWKPTSPAG
jgi:hypothetical protein